MPFKRPFAFKRGDKGPFIADAQEMLARLGFDPGQPEGIFVSRTEDAVRAFQRERGLEVTGVLDCKTLKLLYDEVDPGGYPAVLMEGGGTPEGPGGSGDDDDGKEESDSEGEGHGEGGAGPGAAATAGPGSEAEGNGEQRGSSTGWCAGVLGWFHRLVGGGAPSRRCESVPGGGGAVAAVTTAAGTAAITRATTPVGPAPAAAATASGPQRTIVISVGERALGLYEGNRLVRRYPVAIGKPSTPTPIGTHRILEKVMHPGGALGSRWMAFTYEMHGIHGTNHPELIGQAVSNGCVRMHNANAEELYDMVEVGAPVVVIAGAVESWPGLGKAAGPGAGQPAASGPGQGKPPAAPGGSGQGANAPPPTGGPAKPGGGLGAPGSPRPKDALAGRTYTVQPGDSLWSIAQRFGTTLDAIVAANNIRNPDLIYPGEILRIP